MNAENRFSSSARMGRWLLLCALFVGADHFAAGAHAETLNWVRNAFSLPESIWSIESVDVNADGRLDVVAMGETRVFALVAPDWNQHLLFDSVEPKLLYCVALDADQDGDVDVAIGRGRVPWIVYRLARRAGEAIAAPRGPDFSLAWIENTRNVGEAWPLHVLDRQLNGIHGLWTGDVNSDGVRDLVADSINGPFFANSLVWLQTPGRGESLFKRHVITKGGTDGRPHYLDFADVNGDGRGDVLLGDSSGGTFTWWEQGTGPNQTWTKHLIARNDGATNVRTADANGDGRLDVVGSCGHGTGVFWFEGPAWKKHIIDSEVASPHALAVGDFDADGDTDVAAASYTTFVVRWYENDGHGSFTAHDIDVGNKQQSYDLKAVDLDGDGRLDLLLAGRETRNAVWYRNLKR